MEKFRERVEELVRIGARGTNRPSLEQYDGLEYMVLYEVPPLFAEVDRYRAALEEIASESCTYVECRGRDFPDEPGLFDPECSGEVCTARKALGNEAVRAEGED